MASSSPLVILEIYIRGQLVVAEVQCQNQIRYPVPNTFQFLLACMVSLFALALVVCFLLLFVTARAS
jgi:hypothetical protein